MKLHNQRREADSLEGYSKGEILEFKKQMEKTYDDQLKRITEMARGFKSFGRRLLLTEGSLDSREAKRRKNKSAMAATTSTNFCILLFLSPKGDLVEP